MRRLPPFNALRAFEAAARHLSFYAAAEELRVTPAAVSHQVKALEDDLGVKLFRRFNRAVVLTREGRACLPGLREGFDRLAESMERVRRRDRTATLTVSVAPSFAAKWLVLRLDRFREAYPHIDVRIDASMHLVDFTREDVDVAIRYGRGRYPGLEADLLLRNEVFPVCSPALMEGPHPLRQPENLRYHTLLHDDTAISDASSPDWPMWLRAAGVTGIDATRGPRFNNASVALEAAIAGRGVTLAMSVLAAADLASGRLIKPFALAFPVDFAFYVVAPRASADTPKVKAFRRWLLDEAAQSAPRSIQAIDS